MSKFFKKYTLNNKVEVPSLLAVAPMTIFGSNPDGTIGADEKISTSKEQQESDYIYSEPHVLV